ncbi:hypothetical protein H2199_006786 [Coniosporium tulheliwenetii]|uniref:Uncharacterized protein n=1 Tax=Coniosporium tulheliwenetii TaxID=3383036 RepID=A0ACC2YUC7_9PEZI|nr:hypothetical protein H2199_006786 [Cladosporium sp. JES 115]
MYTTATSCPYPIYTDPTRKIYEKLGMIRTLDLGPTTPSYIQSSLLGVVVSSFWQALSSGRSALKGETFRSEAELELGEEEQCWEGLQAE